MKKKGKNKKKNLVLTLISSLFALVSLLSLVLLPVFEYEILFRTMQTKGIGMILGGEVNVKATLTVGSNVSVSNATYDADTNVLLLIIAAVLVIALLALLVKLFIKKNTALTVLTSLLFIACAVMLFCTKESFITSLRLDENIGESALSYGIYISAACAVIAGGSNIVTLLK